MKRVEISAFGRPEEVARCVDGPDVGQPEPGEVVFDVLAFPINPADVSFCNGRYIPLPQLPATPGAECVGRITCVGADVRHIKTGDLVTNLQRSNWAQRRRVNAEDVIVLPPGIDPYQAAMIRINPATAMLLLADFLSFSPGEWIIQNAANSAVGRHVITLANRYGLRTLNIVRRTSLIQELKALGATVSILDGEDLPTRAAEVTNGAPIRFGLDAISGGATGRVAACLADGGTVVTYGVASGEDPQVGRFHFLTRGIRLTGFVLGRHMLQRDRAGIQDIYAGLGQLMASGELLVPIEAVYPIEDIQAALIHAQRSGRGGKILVTPNGPT